VEAAVQPPRGETPHIDQIADAAPPSALPEDGATIWRDLKRSIIDLNPTRSDKPGPHHPRRRQADRLRHRKRLPDGQTMMTFLDVTESANYQRVLKERNDALVTADRLKDAFVQNVSVRAALAAHQHHRLCRPARLGRRRRAQ
jgi:hypothetical protein